MEKDIQAVVIGASWGGLQGTIELLKEIPPSFACPIILILHRSKDFDSELELVIGKKLLLKVKEAEDKEKLLPGTLYIAPADYHLFVEKEGVFSLDVSERINYSRPSIDVTFESVAEVFEDRVIGIILTGANKDGSKGLSLIASKGGTTIVQDPAEAEMATMPLAALAAVPESYVFSLNQIKEYLLSAV